MFNNLYCFWTNSIDTIYNISKINLWYYINIKFFKLKSIAYISYFISIFSSLKINSIKIYKNCFDFSTIFNTYCKFFIFIIILFLFII